MSGIGETFAFTIGKLSSPFVVCRPRFDQWYYPLGPEIYQKTHPQFDSSCLVLQLERGRGYLNYQEGLNHLR